jgi:hypothetical protein
MCIAVVLKDLLLCWFYRAFLLYFLVLVYFFHTIAAYNPTFDLIRDNIIYININPLSGNAPRCTYFIILLCLMPDDFTHQGESAATQWVNLST